MWTSFYCETAGTLFDIVPLVFAIVIKIFIISSGSLALELLIFFLPCEGSFQIYFYHFSALRLVMSLTCIEVAFPEGYLFSFPVNCKSAASSFGDTVSMVFFFLIRC